MYHSDEYRPSADKKPVSVIICARNEAENLRDELPHFLNQNYRSFEIVVVNDNSSDQTGEVLLDFQNKYANLKIANLCIGKLRAGKKGALSAGIAAAKNRVLLLTDSDCVPATNQWIETMQCSLSPDAEIGLAFGPYRKERGMLNRWIRYETAQTAIQYFSLAIVGLPYMGVGRNLIYTKTIFIHKGGLSRHKNIASGDDDLFINAAADASNVRVILDPASFVYSDPEKSWASYYNQKTRPFSTGRHYRTIHRLLLGLLAVSHVAHYVLGLLLIGMGRAVAMVMVLYLLRMAVVLIISGRIFARLRQTDLVSWLPLLDFSYPLYYLIFSPAVFFGNRKQWK
ncbi:MAG: glycosyltransferase [Saprospiraceae bacterium]|nr:glycosyltransferase [Saprospiraceae bacterium]